MGIDRILLASPELQRSGSAPRLVIEKALNSGERLNPLKKINGKNIFFPEIQVGFNLSQSFLKAFRLEYSTSWQVGKSLPFSGYMLAFIQEDQASMADLLLFKNLKFNGFLATIIGAVP